MAMGRRIKIEKGDTVSSVAFAHGLRGETVWDHPQNAELRRRRRHANILFEGDELYLPDKSERTIICVSNQSHRFVRRGIPEYFRLQLLDVAGNPWAGAPYQWRSESGAAAGRADKSGWISQRILPSDRQAHLTVGEPPELLELDVALGHLDPISTLSGVRQRLANLGYVVGPDEDRVTPELEHAVVRYRADHGLGGGSQVDEALRAALESKHGA